jgi:hypothetical protein
VDKYIIAVKVTINPEYIEKLRIMNNWEHPQAEIAKKTNYTRQYIGLLVKNRIGFHRCEPMIRWIKACGYAIDSGECWCRYLRLEPMIMTEHYQQNNQNKYDGIVPYSRAIPTSVEPSVAASFRMKDRPVELVPRIIREDISGQNPHKSEAA